MKKVEIFTDGSCLRNPGPGGWAAILRYEGVEKILSGAEKSTTNNRMELTAVIQGLKALKEPCEVTVVSDSKYIVDNIWGVPVWRARGWQTSGKKPVKNKDLWEELDSLCKIHQVTFSWVKGHSGHRENELADLYATKAATEQNV